MREAVVELLGDAERAGELGRSGRSLVRERFLLTRLLADELQLYASLLGIASPAGRAAVAGLAGEERDPVCGMRLDPAMARVLAFGGVPTCSARVAAKRSSGAGSPGPREGPKPLPHGGSLLHHQGDLEIWEVTGMMWWHGDLSWWGWTVMTLGMLVFWGLIAWVIVVIARSSNATPSARTPQDILAERYARGEINAEEYHRRLDDLFDHTSVR